MMPLFQAPEEALMGGQAVIEGVMMRSPHSYAVAVRQPRGSLVVKQAYLDRPSDSYPWLKLPVLRGLGVLGQALVLGMRALRYSAEQALEEPDAPGAKPRKSTELSGWMLAANVAFSLAFSHGWGKSRRTASRGDYPATALARASPVIVSRVAFYKVSRRRPMSPLRLSRASRKNR